MSEQWRVIAFPWHVRLVALVQREGDDGLTRAERRHLAKRYYRTACARLSPAEAAALRDRR